MERLSKVEACGRARGGDPRVELLDMRDLKSACF